MNSNWTITDTEQDVYRSCHTIWQSLIESMHTCNSQWLCIGELSSLHSLLMFLQSCQHVSQVQLDWGFTLLPCCFGKCLLPGGERKGRPTSYQEDSQIKLKIREVIRGQAHVEDQNWGNKAQKHINKPQQQQCRFIPVISSAPCWFQSTPVQWLKQLPEPSSSGSWPFWGQRW